jgi:hypothetical protein
MIRCPEIPHQKHGIHFLFPFMAVSLPLFFSTFCSSLSLLADYAGPWTN